MGEFVYLFGGIEKKRRIDRELNAVEEIGRQNDARRGDEQVVNDARFGSVSFCDLDWFQGPEHFVVRLQDGGELAEMSFLKPCCLQTDVLQ